MDMQMKRLKCKYIVKTANLLAVFYIGQLMKTMNIKDNSKENQTHTIILV